MNNFYDISVFLLGDLPIQFHFLYALFAFVLAILCVACVYFLFKIILDLIGVR